MNFRIADTFTSGLARLTNDEQKLVKTTSFDLQMNPASPGMQFHKLDRAKDKHFWSVRVGRDLRLIVHKTDDGLLLCYVGHHDDAYAWAERRKIERHPKTGAAQLVEIRERVEEIVIPAYVEVAQPALTRPPLFTGVSDDEFLGYGVPPEWLADVRRATDETLFDLAEHLPREAAEALLELATGSKPELPTPMAASASAFEHPAALQRFRLMTNQEELERALNAPWDKWAISLHPAQEDLVKRRFNGPARIAGSAGTGKTVVALHRAVFLARSRPEAKVLVTTFSEPLARLLKSKVQLLLGMEAGVRKRISVRAIDAVGLELYESRFGPPDLATESIIRLLLRDASRSVTGHNFSETFLWNEWDSVADAWQVKSWEEYKSLARLGRKTRLGEKQRKQLWQILERVVSDIQAISGLTVNSMFARLTDSVASAEQPLFDHVVVDEAQDLSVAQLRFLAALVGGRPNGLFFTGDLGQRIFQSPFSWKSLGVDVRGRSQTLKINYRTSHQIRRSADRLLPASVSDVDGNADGRTGTLSVFNGVEPLVSIGMSQKAEEAVVAAWLSERIEEGIAPHEVGIFVRSARQLARAQRAVAAARIHRDGDADASEAVGVTVATMHAAKGLEFRAVVVMACDDEVIPLQERVEAVAEESDLNEVYTSERHLLYVACTRARDHLLVTATSPGSEFLSDLRAL